jgi:hypothetical protein
MIQLTNIANCSTEASVQLSDTAFQGIPGHSLLNEWIVSILYFNIATIAFLL